MNLKTKVFSLFYQTNFFIALKFHFDANQIKLKTQLQIILSEGEIADQVSIFNSPVDPS